AVLEVLFLEAVGRRIQFRVVVLRRQAKRVELGAQVAAPIAGELAAYLLRREASLQPKQADIRGSGINKGADNGGDA
ncbi:MAG: hypothetical protein EBT71_06895, partial [Alphaproteobacteria bacterium]|nr:hypothetical protein [Alphaproteobacteria bacterium]